MTEWAQTALSHQHCARGMGEGSKSRKSTCLPYCRPPAAQNGHCCRGLSCPLRSWRCAAWQDLSVLGQDPRPPSTPRCSTETVLSRGLHLRVACAWHPECILSEGSSVIPAARGSSLHCASSPIAHPDLAAGLRPHVAGQITSLIACRVNQRKAPRRDLPVAVGHGERSEARGPSFRGRTVEAGLFTSWESKSNLPPPCTTGEDL